MANTGHTELTTPHLLGVHVPLKLLLEVTVQLLGVVVVEEVGPRDRDGHVLGSRQGLLDNQRVRFTRIFFTHGFASHRFAIE
jgi:hypothetical protein